tara:strand:- start:326 stop:505 length:180 start_codon:yes stop_codon:yes gene_type:complete
MDESFIDIREEMELIKTRQQELIVEDSHGHERELWRLQIVWDYLRDKYIITTKGNGQLH